MLYLQQKRLKYWTWSLYTWPSLTSEIIRGDVNFACTVFIFGPSLFDVNMYNLFGNSDFKEQEVWHIISTNKSAFSIVVRYCWIFEVRKPKLIFLGNIIFLTTKMYWHSGILSTHLFGVRFFSFLQR